MERFREVQRLSENRIALVGISVALAGLGFALHASLARGADLVLLFVLVLVGGVAALLFWGELRTEVHDDALHVRFFPLTRRHVFAWADVASAEPRSYRPIREYGGWGVRWGPSGRAYNVSGKRGVQLVLADGKRVLIGSRRAEELALAIEAARSQAKPERG